MGIGFGGHWGLSILRVELWAHPVRLARGNLYVACPMVHCNITAAMQYHEFVITGRALGWAPAGRLVLDGPRQAVGFHLRPDLRHVVPEHHNVVLLAGLVPDMIPQQRLRLESKALEDRDRTGLIH